MKILFLGYSNILQKRILHAVKKIPKLEYEICSKRSKIDKRKKIIYNDYNFAVKNSDAEIVYVSLKNKDHFKYAKLSLENNKHTIVDKPIVINFTQLQKLLKLSKRRGRVIAESLVFNLHEQYFFLKKFFKKKKNLDIKMCFNIPRLKTFNLSERKKNFEGCMYDLVPYACYVILDLLKNPNIRLIIKKNQKNLNTDFVIICTSKYDNNTFYGNFSHNKEYQNNIWISNETSLLKLERFCAPPPNKKMIIEIKQKNKFSKKIFFKESIFKNFLENFIDVINKKNYAHFVENLTNQIKFRDKIIKKLKVTNKQY